jgi:hypothetical protein
MPEFLYYEMTAQLSATEPLTSLSVFLSTIVFHPQWWQFVTDAYSTKSQHLTCSCHKCAGCAGGHIFETKIIFADTGIRLSRPHNFLSAF